jgi:hypothetical protein
MSAVDPEHLVQDDDGGSRQGFWPGDIGAKRAVPAFYSDAILHGALPQTIMFIPRDVVTIGGGLLSGAPDRSGQARRSFQTS